MAIVLLGLANLVLAVEPDGVKMVRNAPGDL
jgi:hypothetical protein